jgi:hypothetical protein
MSDFPEPAYEKREITAAEQVVLEEMYRRKGYVSTCFVNGTMPEKDKILPTHAYVTAVKPIRMSVWQGHGKNPKFVDHDVPAGTVLKIVMVSRFGDFGLTDNLSADNGYQVRLPLDSADVTNIRMEP